MGQPGRSFRDNNRKEIPLYKWVFNELRSLVPKREPRTHRAKPLVETRMLTPEEAFRIGTLDEKEQAARVFFARGKEAIPTLKALVVEDTIAGAWAECVLGKLEETGAATA